MKKIAFQTPCIDVRGTCTAIYDYAHYNETILNNQSIIVVPIDYLQKSDSTAIDKFKKRFKIFIYNSIENLDAILLLEKCDILYTIKYGKKDGIVSNRFKTVVHCVFDMTEPHGDVYAGVSESLAKKFNQTNFVPHMASMEPTDGDDLRSELNIPSNAIVFGRHGGKDTFNLEWAKEVFSRVVRERDDIYFVFLNAHVFDDHPHIITLQPTADMEYKKKFIRTIDCGLCPESLGHTGGLAIADICAYNKPMMIYDGPVWNTAHIDTMGDKGIYFDTPEKLYELLTVFNPKDYEGKDLNGYRQFDSKSVMEIFKKVFIE